jgi:hypothetical protein
MTNDHGKADGTALSPPNIHYLKARKHSKSIPKQSIPSIQSLNEKETKMTDMNNSNEKKKTVKKSAMKKSPFKAALFDSIDAILEGNDKEGTNDKQTNQGDKGWTEVSGKKNKENQDPTTAVKPADVFRIGINIRMLEKKAKPSSYKPKIAVKAVAKGLLQAFLSVHDQAWLGPIQKNDGETDGIHTDNDINKAETDLSKHFENSKTTNRGHFFARFYLHSNIPLDTYKRDSDFMAWLFAEKISLDINNLATTSPVFAGFFTEVKPRLDLIDLFQARLRENTPTAMPEYELTTTTLYAGGAKARVYIAATAEANVDSVRTLFNSVDLAHDNISFYPWNEFLALNKARKLTIINEQNKFVNMHNSIVLAGFTGLDPQMQIDTVDMTATQEDNKADNKECDSEDTKMDDNNTEEEEHSENSTEKKDKEKVEDPDVALTMTEYLCSQIKAGDGEDLFVHVYPPVLGKIEFMFTPFRYQEALAFLKVAHTELAREMSLDGVRQALSDPEPAILAASQTTEWKPFNLARKIQETATTRKKRNNKRQNTHQKAPTNPYFTNTTATTSATTMNVWNNQATPTLSTISSASTKQTEGAIEILQKQMSDLRTVTAKLQYDNRTIVDSIDNVKTAHKKSTTELQESASQQHESVISLITNANVELEKKLSEKLKKSEQTTCNGIMELLANMRRETAEQRETDISRAAAEKLAVAEEKAAEKAASAAEKAARVAEKKATRATERNEDAAAREQERIDYEERMMLFSSRIPDQPTGDVTKRSQAKKALDMTGAVTGQAHKKSKTTQRVLEEKTQDNLHGVDHPIQGPSKSCNLQGYAADES